MFLIVHCWHYDYLRISCSIMMLLKILMFLKFLNDSWVSYDEIMDDTYVFLEPHSCDDATD